MMETLIPPMFLAAIVVLAIWDTVWKAIGMWKSARNDQLAWFVCITIFNTAGILPIVYILFFQPNPIKSLKKPAKKR